MDIAVLLLLTAVPVAADDCGSFTVSEQALPNGKLMPVTGLYEAVVEFHRSWLTPCPVAGLTNCALPETDRMFFSVESPPSYAFVAFDPPDPLATPDPQRLEDRAATTVRINTTADAVADRTETYTIAVRTCDGVHATVDLMIVNDRLPPSAAPIEAMEVAETAPPTTVTFSGSSSTPAPGFVFAVGAVVLGLIRRRA